MKNIAAGPRKGPSRDPDKEQFWRAMLKAQLDSGLSARAFCRARGLSEPSFYGWRRVLGQRDRHARTPRRRATPTRAKFVELRPTAAGPGAGEVPLELFVGDRRLLIRPGCDRALLREVLAVLESPRSNQTEA